MEDLLTRIFENLLGRVSGPMKFRLILQPLMAILFAMRDGLKDAKKRQPAYFWAFFTNPDHRRDLLRDGWKSVVEPTQDHQQKGGTKRKGTLAKRRNSGKQKNRPKNKES